MNRLNTFLRQLEPWQILAIGVAVSALGVGASVFGLMPLVVLLLLPVGEGYAAVAGALALFIACYWVGRFVGSTIARAYLDRRMDVAMERLYEAFAESKRNGG